MVLYQMNLITRRYRQNVKFAKTLFKTKGCWSQQKSVAHHLCGMCENPWAIYVNTALKYNKKDPVQCDKDSVAFHCGENLFAGEEILNVQVRE